MAAAPPEPDLIVASVLGRTAALVDQACARFSEQFGVLAYVSEPLDFPWTDYYRDELGDSPTRRIVALDRLEDTSRLVELKRATSRLEVGLARVGGPRQVNIDPGTLGAEQLVLASTKPRGHRVHLGRGVYAELTLIWEQGAFAPLPWTYPDYASPELRELFGRLRELLLETRRLSRAAASAKSGALAP
jgi:hypothetical protein